MTRPSAKSDNFFPKVRKAKINTMPYKPFCPKSRKAARAIKMNISFLLNLEKNQDKITRKISKQKTTLLENLKIIETKIYVTQRELFVSIILKFSNSDYLLIVCCIALATF